jgi:uncharacterized protein
MAATSVSTRPWRIAWVGLAAALALHVTDEALTGFLPVYNGVIADIRVGYPWLLLPTFTFGLWLAGLILAVLVLLALTPVVSRGARWIRITSLILAVVMTGNALVHMGASLFWHRLAPGVLSSPLLLAASAALFVAAWRARTRLSLELVRLPDDLAVCRLEPASAFPDWAFRGALSCCTRSADEASIVCPAGQVPPSIRSEGPWRAFMVAGPLDFGLTGILASLAAPLADAGVSIFAISTFDTDYVLVKRHALDAAEAALRAAGHRIR